MTNNPKNRQQWIFDLLKVERLNFSEMFSKYLATFSKSEVTFSKDWNKANERYTQYQNKANEAKEAVSIATEVEAFKSGLKSKIARQMELQNDIMELQNLLIVGKCEDTFISKAEVPKVYMRSLLPSEIANYKKTIIALQKELSLMAGEYAPNKVANTDVDGNDKDVIPQIVITANVSKVRLADNENEI